MILIKYPKPDKKLDLEAVKNLTGETLKPQPTPTSHTRNTKPQPPPRRPSTDRNPKVIRKD